MSLASLFIGWLLLAVAVVLALFVAALLGDPYGHTEPAAARPPQEDEPWLTDDDIRAIVREGRLERRIIHTTDTPHR